jgi:hypothetical protein
MTRRFGQARGAIAGCVAAFGALVAHVAAGGSLELVPGLVVTAVALPLAVALTPRDAVDLPRLSGVALAAQALGHLCLMFAPTGHHAHHPHGAGLAPAMLGLHLLVVAATVAVAAGLDRAALDVVRAAVGWLLPLLVATAPTVVRHRSRASAPVRRLRDRLARRVGRPRAPPARVVPLALCAVR